MPTVDEMKQWRDGHLSYGKVHPDSPAGWMWPVVTGHGYDADGEVVSVLKSLGPDSGEIEYTVRPSSPVRYERTAAGATLFPGREGAP